MDKKNQITEGVIWKQLLIFFFPIMVGTPFQQLYNTVDAIIVGRFVGKQALASVGGSAAVLTNFVIGFFTGLSAGATVIISQFYGAKNLNN
jgi:Na+-driven multidrug efflux pump